MKRLIPTSVLCIVMVWLSTRLQADPTSLDSIRTNLDSKVGGNWHISAVAPWTAVTLRNASKESEEGHYYVFASETNRFISETNQTACGHAIAWIERHCAPFYVLGTNAYCFVVTDMPRTNPVSTSVALALGLKPDADVDEMTAIRKSLENTLERLQRSNWHIEFDVSRHVRAKIGGLRSYREYQASALRQQTTSNDTEHELILQIQYLKGVLADAMDRRAKPNQAIQGDGAAAPRTDR